MSSAAVESPGDVESGGHPANDVTPKSWRGWAVAMSRLTAERVWIIPAVVTVLACLFRLGKPVLWRDELATLSAATRSLSDQFLLEGNTDAVFGAYYAFMHGWTQLFGTSTVALRLPSVLAMGAAAGLLAEIGRRLFGRRAGLIAGLLFAATPAIIRYGHDARSYAGVMAVTLVATLLLLRAVERPEWPRWSAYAVSVSLVGVAHLFALLLLAAHAVFVGYLAWRERDRRLLLRWPIATVAGLVPLVPLARIAGEQRGQVDWIPELTWEIVGAWPQDLVLDAVFAGAVFVLAVLAIRLSGRASVLCLGLATLPVVGLAVMSLAISPVWMPRYVLFTLPGWLLLAGAALARAGRIHAVAAVAALLVVSAPSQMALRSAAGHDDVDHRAIARIVGREARPGDAVLFPYRGRFREGLRHYLSNDRLPLDVMADGSAAGAGTLEVPECSRPERCLGTPPRVWVLCFGDCDNATEGLHDPVREAVDAAGYREADRWRVYRGTVALYER